MERNLLKIATILRPHGIKGAVKVECLVDDGLDGISDIFVGEGFIPARILSSSHLNKDFYTLALDTIKDVDMAEKYRNKPIYIDRTIYDAFKDKVYFSDLIGKKLVSTAGKVLGEVVDYSDFGMSTVLTVRCGAVSYQIPYTNEIVEFNSEQDCFVIDEKRFKEVRV